MITSADIKMFKVNIQENKIIPPWKNRNIILNKYVVVVVVAIILHLSLAIANQDTFLDVKEIFKKYSW